MTVESTSVYTGPYITDGTATGFPFNFKILTAAEVSVEIDGIVIDPSFYSVQIEDQSGTIVFFAAPPSGGSLYVIPDPDFQQNITFSNQAAFLPQSHNEANDRAALRDLVLRSTLDRAVKAPFGEGALTLPPSAERAGKLLAFDLGGKPSAVDIENIGNIIVKTPIVTPEQFGAVAIEDGGSTDAAFAISLALATGKRVSGNGKTYLIGSTIKPSVFAGLQDICFRWISTFAMRAQRAQLHLEDLSDWYLDRVGFDVGTVQNTGFSADSDRQGLRVGSALPNTNFCENFNITNCWAEGDGNGSRFQIRSAKHWAMRGCYVKPGTASYSSFPTNDIINGFDIAQATDFTVSGCWVSDLGTIQSTGRANFRTRGFLLVECSDFNIAGCHAPLVDQGFDFSGGIGAETPAGNRNFSIVGCTANYVGTYGFKLANVARNAVISACVADSPGYIGFVASPSTQALAGESTSPAGQNTAQAKAFNTQNIDFIGCRVTNPRGTSYAAPGNGQGFRVMQNSAYPSWPRGVRFIDCMAQDTQDMPVMQYGFACDTVLDNTTGQFNEIINCKSSGHIAGPSIGFSTPGAQLSRSGPQAGIASATATQINFDAEIWDGYGGHSLVTNNDTYTIQKPGAYRVDVYGEFAADVAGYRRIDLLMNGIAVASDERPAAQSGGSTPLSAWYAAFFPAGYTLKLQVTQTSGAPLSFANPRMMLTLVEVL